MSNALAIAAVTATLRNLLLQGIPKLDAELADLEVTAQPLDKARIGVTKTQLNVFLYQTVLNGAWRNMDMPRQVQPGETGQPPLPLNLYYVLTAYGRGESDNDALSHRVMGGAMSVLHDHPILGAAEIQNALPASDLSIQVERVRITPQPMSIEEMSKLWTAFQTNYRISAAYEVALVLIDSLRPSRTPLPVLTRGPADQGVAAQADLIPPYPAIDEVQPPNLQTSARLGDILTIKGQHLEGSNLGVVFNNLRWTGPVEVAPEPGTTATQLSVKLPNQPAVWPAGFYTLGVLVQRPNESYRRATNELPLSLAPRISNISPNPAARDANGNATLTLTVSPEVRPEQRAALLLGDREVLVQSHAAQTNALTFVVTAASPGDYFVRLRVDGVDSFLVDRSVTPPVFDQTQKVKIS